MKGNSLVNAGEKQPKQKRPSKSEQMALHMEPGDCQKYLAHSMQVMNLPRIDTYDAGEVGLRCQEYFTLCMQNDMKPSIAGMGLALGIDRQTLCDIANGVSNRSKEVTETIKSYRMLTDALMNDYMQNGKINPVSGIFLMKNTLNYRDQAEVVVKPVNPLGDPMERSALTQRLVESVVIDADPVETEPEPNGR